MPWTVADVEKHNKGLTDHQKKVWVNVANSALAKCQKEGGTACDASAIRQANGVVTKNMSYEDWEAAEDFAAELSYFADAGPYGDVTYADPKNKKYPVDTEAHIRAAWSYINMPRNAGQYSPEELKTVKGHIIAAWKSKIDPAGPPSAQKNNAQTQTFNIHGIEIFSVGTWNKDTYTTQDLDEMVKAFNDVGFEPPLKLGHNEKQMTDGHPALGWVNKVYRQGSKLLADFKDIPQKLYQALKQGNYKRVSSEIYWNYSANGKSWPRVLKAVALLGADIPAVTNLEAIQGLYDEGTNHYRVYGDPKDKEDASMEKEIQELKDKLKLLTDASAVEKADLEAKLKAAEDANKEATAKLSEREAEVKAAKIKEFIGKHKKEGRVLPKFEAELMALLASASETKAYSYSHEGKTVELSQRETMERLVGLLPKTVVFGEMGGDDADADLKSANYDNAGIEVDRRAKIYLKKKEGVKTYEEAVKAVLADDPDLKKDYLGGI